MKIPTTLTLEPDVRATLERAAAIQDRTRSWIANRILNRLISMGMLSPDQRTERGPVGAALLLFIRAESSPVGPRAFLGMLVEALERSRLKVG